MDNKQNVIKAMGTTEFNLEPIEENIDLKDKTMIPIYELASLGTTVAPLATLLATFTKGGQSGFYRVAVTAGSHLAKLQNGKGYIGGALNNKTNKVGGQSVLTPVKIDPQQLAFAIAVLAINVKLDEIKETQKDIMSFLQEQEKAKQRGNIRFLNDILNNYKYNYENDSYKKNNHIKVLDIKQESEQSIIFYTEQIKKQLDDQSMFNINNLLKDKMIKLQELFKEYQLSVYLYSFSSFLEVLLLENFEEDYLDNVVMNIQNHSYHYKELYTSCYNAIKYDNKKSVESYVLKGLTKISKATGEAVAKIPKVSDSQIDETLIAASDKLSVYQVKRIEMTMEQMISMQSTSTLPFIDNINTMNRIYNKPLELIFDGEHIYMDCVA